MSPHENHPRTRKETTSRRSNSSRNRKVLLAVALVAVVTMFYSAAGTINALLPELLALHGYSQTATFITTTISAGLIAGMSTLFAGIVDRARREPKRALWTPYGIRGTANARKCRSYSITAKQ